MGSSSSQKLHASLLATLLGLSCSGLQAANNSPLITEDDLYSELPFTLTATRLPQAIKDSPVSITVIDRDMIEAYDPQELIDVLRLVPGFQVVHPRGHRVSTAYHGLGTEYAQRMQVLIDGRSVYSPMFGHVQWSDLALEVEDIERIEVSRGPNAASYGANAFTATVNIITRHPVDTQWPYFKVVSGTNATKRYLARFGGHAEKVDYRLSISQRSDNGFDTNEFPDDKRISSLSFRGDYQANIDNSFQFQFGLNEKIHQEGNTDVNDILVDPLRSVDTSTNFQLAKWRHQVNATEEFSLQFYHNFEQVNDDFLTAPIDDIVGAGFATAVGIDNERLALSNSHRAQRYDLEFQHTLKPHDDLRLVWGLSARLDQVGAKGFFNRSSNQDYFTNHTYRLFAHSEWRPNPSWTLNAGLMVENNDLTGTDLSPRLAVNHHFTGNHTLRASYSRALRTPSILEEHADSVVTLRDGTPLDQLLLTNGNLQPEKITSLELAYIGRFPKYGVDLDVKLFYDRIRNVLNQYEDEGYSDHDDIGVALSDKVLIFGNDGYTNLKGLEAQLKYDLSKGTRLHLGYTVLDVEGRTLNEINSNGVIGRSTFNDHQFAAPRTIATLQLIQDIDHDLRGSVAFHRYSRYEFGGGDKTGDYKILNWRLAKKFRSGNKTGQVAMTLQNGLDEHFDFEREQVFESRVFLSLELGFN